MRDQRTMVLTMGILMMRYFGVPANVTDLEEQRTCEILAKRIVRGDRK